MAWGNDPELTADVVVRMLDRLMRRRFIVFAHPDDDLDAVRRAAIEAGGPEVIDVRRSALVTPGSVIVVNQAALDLDYEPPSPFPYPLLGRPQC